MSLRLTDFGTFDEVRDISYFAFTINNFSKIKENKLSKPFRHAGHIWKLQVRKKNEYLGMFIRWYGTKIGYVTHVRCSCKTGLGFSVLNHFDTSQTVHEGNLNDEDVFDRIGSGIGYGEVLALNDIQNTHGFVVSDKVVLHLRLRVKSTTFIDKIQVTVLPDQQYIRSLKFHFHAAEWSFILFPSGERKKDESETELVDEDERATLYLARDPITNNRYLRHSAVFDLFIEGGPSFKVKQNFHENQSLVFGTGYLMTSKQLLKIGRSSVVRVGVTFIKIKPYFNFGYNLELKEGIILLDLRDIPWLFKLDTDEKENLSCWLTVDPDANCKKIKALSTGDKKLKALWHARIINFHDADFSVDVWSEQQDDVGLFKYAGESNQIQLPIKEDQASLFKSLYIYLNHSKNLYMKFYRVCL